MNPNSIQVLPYAPLSTSAMIVIIVVSLAAASAVILGLVLHHKRKLKCDEQDHVEAMADITSKAK